MFYRIVRAIHDMELQRNTHHVFRIMYHFVWIPKYRRKVFTEPYRTALKSVIEQIGYDYNIEIVELEVPVDHIHMVVRTEPKVCPSDIMQIIKSISARQFFRLYSDFILKLRKNISGVANYGLKVTLLRRLVMPMKKLYVHM